MGDSMADQITDKDYFLKRKEVERERKRIKKLVSDQEKKIIELEKEVKKAEDQLSKLENQAEDFELKYPEFLKKCRPISEAPKDGSMIMVYHLMDEEEDHGKEVRWGTNQDGKTGWVVEDYDEYVLQDEDLIAFKHVNEDDQ
jgi:chromosome segregation ATPase